MSSRTKVRAATVALACALSAAGGAHADTLVQSSLGGLRATLTDLAPDDGVAPSIAFLPGAPAALEPGRRGELAINYVAATGTDSQATRATTEHLALLAAAPGYAVARATLANRGDATGMSLGVAASTDDHPTVIQSAQARAISDTVSFVLSPHTLLTLTIGGTYSVTLDDNARDLFFFNNALHASLLGPDGGTLDWGDDSVFHGRPFDRTPGPYTLDEDFTLTVHLANTGDAAWNGIASFSSSAWARTDPLPVPEPGGVAMLVVGLGLLGWRNKQRRSRESGNPCQGR